MPKIFISTVPFGEIDPKAVQLLQQTGWEFEINSLGRKLKPEEVAELAGDCDGLIAGTEGIGTLVESSKKLKMISRVGIGLDSVPLNLCRTKGIVVSYTPDAVTKAVAELTLGAMLSITRFVPQADRNMRKRDWKRLMGKRIEHSVIGILGMGRIGTKVMHMLAGFSPQEILIADIKDKQKEIDDLRTQHGLKIRQVEKIPLFSQSDLISLHVPLTPATRNLINKDTLQHFRKESFLFNYSRGDIVHEGDLYDALRSGSLAGAAIDVFNEEPYHGPLIELDQVLLTPHMGSCSFDCRAKMELQATEDLIRFFKGQKLENEVPVEEYLYQQET